MNNTSDISPFDAAESGRKPFFFRRNFWRGLVFIGVAVITLLALLYTIEDVRGRRAWRAYERQLLAKGNHLDWKSLVPASVSDDQNFAMTPFLKPLLHLQENRQPGETKWADTNGFDRAKNFGSELGQFPSAASIWVQGTRVDLPGWYESYRISQEKKAGKSVSNGKSTNAPVDRVTAARAALEAVRPCEPVLIELKEAAKRQHSRYPIHYDDPNPFGILLPHLGVTKKITQVLHLRATASLATGDTAQAWSDLELMVAVFDSIKEEPVLISKLVRFACVNLIAQVVWEGMADGQWTDPQLQRIQGFFEKIDFITEIGVAYRAEQAFTVKFLNMVRESGNRASEMAILNESGDSNKGNPWLGNLIMKCVPDGWFYLEQRNLIETSQAVTEQTLDAKTMRIDPVATDRIMGQFQKKPRDLSILLSHQLITYIAMPALGKVNLRTAYGQTTAHSMIIACALERWRKANGAYPERLDQLAPKFLARVPGEVVVDQPLKYRREDDGGYLLYSVGWNQKDEQGTPEYKSKSKLQVEESKGDWPWRSSRASGSAAKESRAS